MGIDWRLVVVLLPLIVAGSWAVFNVGRIALEQLQNFLNKEA